MTTTEKKRIDRQTMCNRLAMEFEDGWVANLGVGMPTLCSNYEFADKDIVFQSENGLIGYGPLAAEGEEHPNLVNAGVQYVTMKPGASILHHADSFTVIRRRLRRRDGARRIRGRGERRLRQLEDGRPQGRRHRRPRWTSPSAPSASGSPSSTPPATASRGSSTAASSPSPPSTSSPASSRTSASSTSRRRAS